MFKRRSSLKTLLLLLFTNILSLTLILLFIFNFGKQSGGAAPSFFNIFLIYLLILAVIYFIYYFAFHRFFLPIYKITEKALKVFENYPGTPTSDKNEKELLEYIFTRSVAQIDAFHHMNIDKIIAERKKLEHIIEQLVGGILIVNPNNKIIICNHVLAEWYNLDKVSITNKELSDIEQLSIYAEMIHEITRKKDKQIIHRKIYINHNGKPKTKVLQASATNIFTSGKTFLGTSVYVRDITKEHEVDKLKTELLSIVAHELRSPMVSIIGFSEMLLEERTDQAACKEYLSIIHHESSRLSEFIDNFLDLTRIESGKFKLNMRESNFITMVKQVLELYKSQAKSKNITLKTDFFTSVQMMEYDVFLMERAIGNYLSNAIKYSPEHTEILIKTYIDNKKLFFEICDNGTGIPEEEQKKIFNKFYRITAKNVQEKTGSGLGLSFVKRVIEKHRGEVYLKSKINKGSIFGFSIPLK